MKQHLRKFIQAFPLTRAYKRFQKRRLRKQYTATVRLKPGVTNIRLTVNGQVQADLVLTDIMYDRTGPTTARFMSRDVFLNDRRVR